ncbi:unnamed protein product [Nippostrongylus brasiliensis]|uniref:Signal recognition particle, subunit Srp19 n=1 Tax=Nippostrongylus brasiliensis TaxID=27835 RepID=A0A0N4YMJ8_NIPBR|nr:unnamed protein product [Nippostrongylus brasiliensis]
MDLFQPVSPLKFDPDDPSTFPPEEKKAKEAKVKEEKKSKGKDKNKDKKTQQLSKKSAAMPVMPLREANDLETVNGMVSNWGAVQEPPPPSPPRKGDAGGK